MPRGPAVVAATGVIVTCVLAARPPAAHAQALPALGGGSGAAPARAGTGVAASDDGGALWLNPAGLARRGEWRLQLGAAWSLRATRFRSSEDFGALAPAEARQLAVAEPSPSLAVQGGLGERVVVGVAWLTPTATALAWPEPDADAYDPMDDQAERARLPHRYAAGASEAEVRGVAAGVSLRALPWLAVGASAWALHARVATRRTLWGGLGPIRSVPTLSPAFDLAFAAEASGWTWGGALGVLAAPPDAPLELALSLSTTADAALTGTPTLGDSRGSDETAGRYVTAEVAADARAELRWAQPWTLRAGTRFLAERWTLEVDAEVSRGGAAAPTWRLAGVGLTHFTGATAELAEVPLGARVRDTWALRAAFDVDLLPGFLAASAGWAYESGASAAAALSPALPGRAAHLVALGAAARSDGFTVTLGATLYLMPSVTVSDGGAASVIAPLASGAPPAARGRTSGSAAVIGAQVEASF